MTVRSTVLGQLVASLKILLVDGSLVLDARLAVMMCLLLNYRGIVRGLEIAWDQNFTQIHVEVDSLAIINAIIGHSDNLNYQGNLIRLASLAHSFPFGLTHLARPLRDLFPLLQSDAIGFIYPKLVVEGQDIALLVGAWISSAYVDRLQVEEFGLIPLNVATWGPFVLLNVVKENSPHQEVGGNMVENEWLGSYSDTLKTNGEDSSLSYVCSRVYDIECNWKIDEKVSIQRCEGGSTGSEDDFG
ncbi:hypothetical protein GH714_010244 [Hevea brasiliensis]|uniref:RNase H type-1 domain-containing protein n=1 Tax=Hevea brasiliensis TaxID=3981 RepID=A0A6A6N9G2_HEVBR|nr:hypothetical protein GH714_010244 [Hevea brasiliensis]